MALTTKVLREKKRLRAPNGGAEMNDEEKLADCAPAAEGGWRAILFY